jgi:hypothetical protein
VCPHRRGSVIRRFAIVEGRLRSQLCWSRCRLKSRHISIAVTQAFGLFTNSYRKSLKLHRIIRALKKSREIWGARNRALYSNPSMVHQCYEMWPMTTHHRNANKQVRCGAAPFSFSFSIDRCGGARSAPNGHRAHPCDPRAARTKGDRSRVHSFVSHARERRSRARSSRSSDRD